MKLLGKAFWSLDGVRKDERAPWPLQHSLSFLQTHRFCPALKNPDQAQDCSLRHQKLTFPVASALEDMFNKQSCFLIFLQTFQATQTNRSAFDPLLLTQKQGVSPMKNFPPPALQNPQWGAGDGRKPPFLLRLLRGA